MYTSVYDASFSNPTTPGWLKAAGVKSLRYPGGSYSDLYHWSTHSGTTSLAGTASEAVPTITEGSDIGSFIALLEKAGAHGMVTVNYGSNPAGDGPGVPQEAAAWVAYANGSPSSTVAIGMDASGTDWKTVGYWAGLRAAGPVMPDDGLNFLRISHPNPVGIKYWEVGNEIYGNGFYYGGTGWEEDLHLSYTGGANRLGNAALSPNTYGATFPMYAKAMKAVDSTIKVGAIVHWPYTEYTNPNWNTLVLTADTCAQMDFGIDHWYAGTSLTDLLTRPSKDIPMMFSQLHGTMNTACGSKGMTMPIAVTEWGPNYQQAGLMTTLGASPRMNTQTGGIYAANSYAYFMEQGALSINWLEMHADSFLGSTGVDTPSFAYNGTLMASLLAIAGDTMVQATVGGAATLLEAHAAKHADGSIAVMLVNNNPSTAAAVTVSVSGLATGKSLPCVGTSYAYAPITGSDDDGTPSRDYIFSKNNAVPVSVPAHAVVDVVFPAP
jgi:alpha-L-arabinofuranosidase